LHERESTIEVVLPFLQARLGEFRLVPILAGDFVDYHKRFDENAVASVAERIREVVDDRTLIVVSSDFTHFGNNFSYRPFRENILENIEALDKEAFRLILKRDSPGFHMYLEETKNTICGKAAIEILLKLLPPTAQGRLLKYDVSARKTGDTRASISYASIVFTDSAPPRKGAAR
jgi:AmmeMemoRadiSam system protein B